MNKKYLFLILCVWLSNNVFGQFVSTVMKGKFVEMEISVNLLKNNQYLVILQYFYNFNICEYGLSAGDYYYHKDTLILKDAYYNYALKFLRKNDELFPVKSFPWMQNKLTMYGAECKETYKNIPNIINYYKPLLNYDNNEYHKLFYGKYEYDERSIILKKENYYICKIDDLIISEGKFVYNGKFIRFYDKDLNFSFIGNVKKDDVCVGFFPFENSCFVIKR